MIQAGIYGEMKGQRLEEAYFYANNFLFSKHNSKNRVIDKETYQALMLARKCSEFDEMLAKWKKLLTPTQYEQYETFRNEQTLSFTDDTILSIATMEAILENSFKPDFVKFYLKWARKYPDAGWGGEFRKWFPLDDPQPYRSWGNGAAMRVSPVALMYPTIEKMLLEAKRSAIVTHNHPEGYQGALVVAAAVYDAFHWDKKRPSQNTLPVASHMRYSIEQDFFYDVSRKLSDIQSAYKFSSRAIESVPESIICFLESVDVASAINNALILGGDQDTQAMIAGCIAQASYKKVPKYMIETVEKSLPEEMLIILEKAEQRYGKYYEVV